MFTDTQILALEKRTKPYKRHDGDGLYIEVRPDGSRHWKVKFVLRGQRLFHTLSPAYPELSAEAARNRRIKSQARAKDGVDPRTADAIEAEQARQAALRFEAVTREWHAIQAPGWNAKTAHGNLALFENHVFDRKVRQGTTTFGQLYFDEITKADVLEVCRAAQADATIGIGHDVRNRIGRVLRTMGERLTVNPADQCIGLLTKRKRGHFKALPTKLVPMFYRDLIDSDARPATVIAMRLMMRWVLRANTLANAEWRGVDLDPRYPHIRVPARNMKDITADPKATGDFLVPLAPSSIALLKELHPLTGQSRYLFPHRDDFQAPMGKGRLLYVIERLGYLEFASVHGFRTMFMTAVLEHRAHWEKYADVQLDHVERDPNKGAYKRARFIKHRIHIMQWWAKQVTAFETGAQAVPGRVVRRSAECVQSPVVIAPGALDFDAFEAHRKDIDKHVEDAAIEDAEYLEGFDSDPDGLDDGVIEIG